MGQFISEFEDTNVPVEPVSQQVEEEADASVDKVISYRQQSSQNASTALQEALSVMKSQRQLLEKEASAAQQKAKSMKPSEEKTATLIEALSSQAEAEDLKENERILEASISNGEESIAPVEPSLHKSIALLELEVQQEKAKSLKQSRLSFKADVPASIQKSAAVKSVEIQGLAKANEDRIITLKAAQSVLNSSFATPEQKEKAQSIASSTIQQSIAASQKENPILSNSLKELSQNSKTVVVPEDLLMQEVVAPRSAQIESLLETQQLKEDLVASRSRANASLSKLKTIKEEILKTTDQEEKKALSLKFKSEEIVARAAVNSSKSLQSVIASSGKLKSASQIVSNSQTKSQTVKAKINKSILSSIRSAKAESAKKKSVSFALIQASKEATLPEEELRLQVDAEKSKQESVLLDNKAKVLSQALVLVQENPLAAVEQSLKLQSEKAVVEKVSQMDLATKAKAALDAAVTPEAVKQASISSVKADLSLTAADAKVATLQDAILVVKSATVAEAVDSDVKPLDLELKEKTIMASLQEAEAKKIDLQVKIGTSTTVANLSVRPQEKETAVKVAEVAVLALEKTDERIAELRSSLRSIALSKTLKTQITPVDVISDAVSQTKADEARFLAEAAVASSIASKTMDPKTKEAALSKAKSASNKAALASVRSFQLQKSLSQVKLDSAIQKVASTAQRVQLTEAQSQAAKATSQRVIQSVSAKPKSVQLAAQKEASLTLAAMGEAKSKKADVELAASQVELASLQVEDAKNVERQWTIALKKESERKVAAETEAQELTLVKSTADKSGAIQQLVVQAAQAESNIANIQKSIAAARKTTLKQVANQSKMVTVLKARSAKLQSSLKALVSQRQSLNQVTGSVLSSARGTTKSIDTKLKSQVSPALIQEIVTVSKLSKAASIRDGKEVLPDKSVRTTTKSIDNALKTSGMNIDQFETKDFLGEGAFGKVFSAVNKTTGVTVVIKEIPKSKVDMESLLTEINILKTLHPVCTDYILCYDQFFQNETHYYILTEFLDEYKSLDNVCNGKMTVEPDVLALIIRNLILGLQVIHKMNVAHRDIKPENILVTKTGKIKYIDFGLSCMLSGCNSQGASGTPSYMAPDLILAEKKVQGGSTLVSLQKTDLWSLGMLIFELINQKNPFTLWLEMKLLDGTWRRQPAIVAEVAEFLRSWSYADRASPLGKINQNTEITLATIGAGFVSSQNGFSLNAMLSETPEERSLPEIGVTPNV